MNKNKRAKLKEASDLISKAGSIVEGVMEDEQECLDNMPENLQGSERCSAMEEAIDNMGEALDHIALAEECIDNVE